MTYTELENMFYMFDFIESLALVLNEFFTLRWPHVVYNASFPLYLLDSHLIQFINPSNAKATFTQSIIMQRSFWKASKPCHVGFYRIALFEHSQMSTHMPGFQSFFSFFASFYIAKISHQRHKVKSDYFFLFQLQHCTCQVSNTEDAAISSACFTEKNSEKNWKR